MAIKENMAHFFVKLVSREVVEVRGVRWAPSCMSPWAWYPCWHSRGCIVYTRMCFDQRHYSSYYSLLLG